jgi:hypothetical protein
MKSAKHHVLSVLLVVAAGGLGMERMPLPPQEPAASAIRQRREAFLEGVLFAAQERESSLNKPPARFNTKDVLTGIEGVEVVVENLPAVVEKYGLRKQDLHTAIEQQLRQRRIDVIEEPQTEGPPAEDVEQTQEPDEALMQMANSESEEKFLEDVRAYLQQRQPRSSSAILDVSINAVAEETAGFASYSIHVQFVQTVVLLGPNPRRSHATTWQMATVGYVSLDEFNGLGGRVRDAVEEFISDYIEANPDKGLRAVAPRVKVPPKGIITGIVRSGDSATAVVGTQIVREGETIDGVRVIKIHDDRVEFEKAGQRWTQKLNEPPGSQWE